MKSRKVEYIYSGWTALQNDFNNRLNRTIATEPMKFQSHCNIKVPIVPVVCPRWPNILVSSIIIEVQCVFYAALPVGCITIAHREQGCGVRTKLTNTPTERLTGWLRSEENMNRDAHSTQTRCNTSATETVKLHRKTRINKNVFKKFFVHFENWIIIK